MRMKRSAHPRAHFSIGSITARPDLNLLSGPKGSASLEPKIMDVLCALAEQPDVAISRSDLIDRIWKVEFGADESLTRAVSLLRKSFTEIGGAAYYIETIPKRGYRLVEPMAVDDTPGGAAPAPGPTLGRAPSAISRRAALGFALSAAGGYALWALLRDPARAEVNALLAQSELAMRSGLPDSEAQGVGFLETAAKTAPDDARIWGKLALARTYVAEYAPPDQVSFAVAGVQDAVRRALALQPRQADAHAALALLTPYFGDWLVAERRMQAVLDIDAKHLPTLDALAFLRVGVGRARESARDRLIFSAREPLHVIHQYRLIYAHWILGDDAAADRAAVRALDLWPKHPAVWFARLWTLAFSGRASRALALVENAAARPDMPPWMIETLLTSMRALDSRRPADTALAVERILGDVSRGPSMSVNALLLLNGLGEIDRAFEVAHAYLLEEGPLMAQVKWRPGDVSVNDQRYRKTHMLFIPVSAPMRADPRFLPFAEKLGLADYWRAAGVNPDFLRTA